MSNKDKFSFVMPAEIVKSEDGEWRIAGLASTGDMDQQGETIMQKGIDLSPIDENKGYFNFDHLKGPENLIGTIDGYKQTNKGLYVHGKLFKNHDKAKSVYQIMSSLGKSDTGRIGLSVEGQILERDPKNPTIIKKCKISKVAITLNPVNQNTYADLIKSMSTDANIEFDANKDNYNDEEANGDAMFTAEQVVQIIKKAMAIGEGYTQAPNKLTDGDAMATSDLKPDVKKKKKKENSSDANSEKIEKKVMKSLSIELYKSNMLGMLDQLQQLYPGCSRTQLWTAVKERMETKFPDIDYPE